MNHLAGASSAYLRQHADNPVQWHPWGPEALALARTLDQPILLSIGYAACHWCHVMAHESFEDPDIAQLINASFVPIKVDREERPDVDALYMAATQLLSGHGGWPMTVFLLPDTRPFMAGTYYPPVDRPGQVGFTRLLVAMTEAWTTQRSAVEEQARELARALEREVAFVDHLAPYTHDLDLRASRQKLRDYLVSQVDEEGGFGTAPKFPRPSFVDALLDFDDAPAIDAVERTLDAMARRGLYDHLLGGFARYSVDAEWHVPHFEKMLSDQALLARTYLRADRRMGGRPEWRAVARDTLRFVLRDLDTGSGYASSLDADAGGHEGSHATWTITAIDEALGLADRLDDRNRVFARWRVTTPGHFEGRSILRLGAGEAFETPSSLQPALEALRAARARRTQPGRDDKVILEWNAMFASACLQSGEPEFVGPGLALLTSLATSHFADGVWWRTEQRQAVATAADVAWLLDAQLDAFETTGDDHWLTSSQSLARYLVDHYWDGTIPSARTPSEGRGLFSQSDLVNDLPARPKEIFDGATPSSHAVACRALARLALCTGEAEFAVVAQRLVELGASLLANHPESVPDLVNAAGFALAGVEIVIPGAPNELSHHVRSLAMPRTVLITGAGSSALLEQRVAGRAYVCRAGVCRRAVATVAELDAQLHDLVD